jgi:hypothetical protein
LKPRKTWSFWLSLPPMLAQGMERKHRLAVYERGI